MTVYLVRFDRKSILKHKTQQPVRTAMTEGPAVQHMVCTTLQLSTLCSYVWLV
jgi:hypothetical protein